MSRRRAVITVLILCLGAMACSAPSADPAAAPFATPGTTPAATARAAPFPTPTGRVLRYVALGDSLASGLGGEPSYADFLGRGLQRRTGRQVELTNLGRPGWTSAQLLEALRSSQQFRTAVAEADVVSWDIGGNDIITSALRSASGTCGGADGLRCVRVTTQGFTATWAAIVEELLALRKSPTVALLTFDIYTPFIPPQIRTDALVDQLATMNETIAAADGQRGVEVAAVAHAFVGASDLIDDDGLHPSRQGHRRIAELLLGLSRPPED